MCGHIFHKLQVWNPVVSIGICTIWNFIQTRKSLQRVHIGQQKATSVSMVLHASIRNTIKDGQWTFFDREISPNMIALTGVMFKQQLTVAVQIHSVCTHDQSKSYFVSIQKPWITSRSALTMTEVNIKDGDFHNTRKFYLTKHYLITTTIKDYLSYLNYWTVALKYLICRCRWKQLW